MNKQTLAILSIIALGSIVSVAYATSTVISNAGITTPSLNATNITVSGTCTGCGAGEGSYSNYNTVLVNKTFPQFFGSGSSPTLSISNNGTVLWADTSVSFAMNISGTLIESGSSSDFGVTNQNVQSMTGVYKILQINNGTGSIFVIKNESILQKLGINGAQFQGGLNTVGDAISPNGKYIAFGREDSILNSPRILILEGS